MREEPCVDVSFSGEKADSFRQILVRIVSPPEGLIATLLLLFLWISI